jgi:hypothetical protein
MSPTGEICRQLAWVWSPPTGLLGAMRLGRSGWAVWEPSIATTTSLKQLASGTAGPIILGPCGRGCIDLNGLSIRN